LDGSDATETLVPPLPQRLFHELAAAMTELGEFGAARGDFDQGAARPCNGAFEQCYEHPWSAKAHTFAKLLRPRPIGHFFGDDGLAHGHDLVDETAMQALAVSSEPAFAGGFAPPGSQKALTVLPCQAPLPLFLDPPLLIEVLRVVGATLAVHLALQSSNRLDIRCQLGAEELQAWCAFTGDDGKCGGSQIQANGVAADRVFGLLGGDPLQCKLNEVALARSIGPCSTRTARLAHY
jgi:hypothetical protein